MFVAEAEVGQRITARLDPAAGWLAGDRRGWTGDRRPTRYGDEALLKVFSPARVIARRLTETDAEARAFINASTSIR